MERPDLAPYAARSSNSRGRRHTEPFKDNRPAFERDRDRIIHCAAFRRLEYKTQVFVNHEGDYYRTRLTHSLEVAQIARGIARQMRLNEDLVEALALAHDLGHTPFGHSGEEVLSRLMADQGGFEHNRQSLRIVELLEERYPGFCGLNLSWETREGIIKHSCACIGQEDDAALADYDPRHSPAIEAQIIDLADEIAYNNHDIDDGLKSGYVTLIDLEQVAIWEETWMMVAQKFPGADQSRHIHQTISHLIGALIQDLVTTTTQAISAAGIQSVDDVRSHPAGLVGFSPGIAEKNQQLKTFLHKYLYRHYKVERMRLKTERCLTFLFDAYVTNPQLLPLEQQKKMDQHGHKRAICDYIAGMTDRYALDEFRRLVEPYEPV
ncbi:dGTPase [Geoalkalibacter ferrihydriticus]|uniref:Deoxyguanosinetriphosphate triphosphohydrolase-like protein n=2 Tax=Geoalkalibacter ferrihydriticus TaxID=392333 RepID=A0A0C2EFL9_9BACT|nr:deoxyguanosinetriphosphate triphosphohydrolase [Geoalkalibacter ferrihydriticus]KIH77413.1 deoxyguanosinetriphosphate triphosphohydrolase [Geoalkalibacter ferrihydriticus DSM 17813]SDM16115.1 dGTPase [Geoalkalibacter ferrihydriticus]